MNKRSILLLVGVVFCVSLAWGQQRVSVDEEGVPAFEVVFPKKGTEVVKQEHKIAYLGDMTVTSWCVGSNKKGAAFLYGVGHAVIPKNMRRVLNLDPSVLQMFLQTALATSSDKLGGSDFQFEDISDDHHTIFEVRGKVAEERGEMKARVYKVGNELLLVGGGGEGVDMKEVDKFLYSFQLKSKQ